MPDRLCSSAGACVHLHTFLGAERGADVFPVSAAPEWKKVFAVRDKALLALETGIGLTRTQASAALVTGPVSKHALQDMQHALSRGSSACRLK